MRASPCLASLVLLLNNRSFTTAAFTGRSRSLCNTFHRPKFGSLMSENHHAFIGSIFNPARRCLAAKPKRGSIVDSYQTVSVNCKQCGLLLFRYKKKNGTKSNLIKCYIERIAEDCAGVLRDQGGMNDDCTEYHCPECQSRFARPATIKGMPALKLVGGKIRMTKK